MKKKSVLPREKKKKKKAKISYLKGVGGVISQPHAFTPDSIGFLKLQIL